MKKILLFVLFGLLGSSVFAQYEQYEEYEERPPKIYFGMGAGFDYGGLFGGKIEWLPIKYFGVFAGCGYNLLSFGWNVGGTIKMLPDKKVSPNLVLMYGYNGVIVGADSYSRGYEMTSYGITLGINFDIKVGARNKISLGLLAPFRSREFIENYNDAMNNPNMSLTPLLRIAISIGYNFGK